MRAWWRAWALSSVPSLLLLLATVRSTDGGGGSGWKTGDVGGNPYWSGEERMVPDLGAQEKDVADSLQGSGQSR